MIMLRHRPSLAIIIMQAMLIIADDDAASAGRYASLKSRLIKYYRDFGPKPRNEKFAPKLEAGDANQHDGETASSNKRS